MAEHGADDTAQFGIAVIGMAARLPGAATIDEFWDNLVAGRESITAVPGDGPPAAGVLTGADRFDAGFFGYSAREAELLDPQQRVLLETAWHAMESAGYVPSGHPATVGVYVGTGLPTYLLFNLVGGGGADRAQDSLGVMMGNDKGFAATRVAYHLDLRGPALDINTACSTSLVAVATACEALLSYQCDLALAGGSAVNAAPERGHPHSEGGPVSPDGRCRPFDVAAGGTVFGSGVGLVVLKRLEDALSDGDRIRAVIRGSAVNNDGAIKVGFSAPGVDGQTEVVSRALAMAGVPAESVRFIEAHGTGTRLGDPIEVAALCTAYGARGSSGWCALGSLKANVGHLDAAAGVAGLIKAVLVLEHGLVPPVANFREPNPELGLEGSPFFVNREPHRLSRGGTPLRAGVSSFGFGGTNAHVVLEEAPPRPAVAATGGPHLLPVSARDRESVTRAGQALADHLAKHPELDLGDVAHTLHTGRRHFRHRTFAVGADHESVVAALRHATARPRLAEPSVTLLFPGQGTLRAGTGQELMAQLPSFRDTVDQCAEILRPSLGLDVRDALFPTGTEPPGSPGLDDTLVAQPALFVAGYAMAMALRGLGVTATAMIGHSVGEYVAACLAGVFPIEDALGLVATRARLVQTAPEGAMLSVDLPERQCTGLLAAGVEVAATNTAGSTVLAGTVGAISDIEQRLLAAGVPHRRLRTNRAFHSSALDRLLPDFRSALAAVTMSAPTVPYVSTLTGDWIAGEQAVDPEHWVRHLRQPVRWHAGMTVLLREPGRVLVDTGLPPAMATLVRHHPGFGDEHRVVTLGEPASVGLAPFLRGIGELWAAGVDVEAPRLACVRRPQPVDLPGYPFRRDRYWIEPRQVAPATGTTTDPRNWIYAPSWQRDVEVELHESSRDGTARTWLLLADPATADELAGNLRRAGDTVVVVSAATAFGRTGERAYTVRPTADEDYRLLLDDLAEHGWRPGHVVHMWGMRAADDRTDPGQAVDEGFTSLLALARSVTGRPGMGRTRISVLVTGVESVTGAERIVPERATVLGASRVIPHEYPDLDCHLVDVAAADVSATALERELRGSARHPVVALRGTSRWLPHTVRVRPHSLTPAPRQARGTYLVTGAFGRIGRVVARGLAGGGTRLVLVGRTEVPDPAPTVPAPLGEAVARRVRLVAELRAAGAEVLAVAADVTDRDALAAAIARGRDAFGPFHGVAHCAGDTDAAAFAPIADLDHVRSHAMLRSRLVTPGLLDELLAGEAMDFRVLTSSLAASLGGPGLAAYAAGHAYLDSYATCHGPWQAVGWDVWRDPEQHDPRRSDLVDEDSGGAIHAWFAGRGVSRVLISVTDLDSRRERWAADPATPGDTAMSGGELHSRPDLAQPYVAPETELQSAIAEVWRQLLRLSRVGVHDNFFELGGDSILGTQLVVRLRAALGREIPVAALFDSPTIAALAEAMHDHVAELVPAITPRARVATSRRTLAGRTSAPDSMSEGTR